MKLTDHSRKTTIVKPSAISRLTAAALVLPGLLPIAANAAEDDSVDFQYSHYQEGRRENQATFTNGYTGKTYTPPDKRAPIEVDSLHGSAKVTLTDRIKFAFNYTQDTWSGATPIGTAPQGSTANRINLTSAPKRPDKVVAVAGASPIAQGGDVFDKQGNLVTILQDPKTFQIVGLKMYQGVTHVMSYASPETRKQGDFKLSYELDEAAIDLGGGLSLENDYESRFVNLGGRMDFNQKQTTVDLGLSYTNSDINATLNHEGINFYTWSRQHADQIFAGKITGNRQDWTTRLGLTQVINQTAVANIGMNYSRSTGFLENPYKLSWFYGPASFLTPDLDIKSFKAFIEQRPDERNLFNWNIGWSQYVEPWDAALHFKYGFAHDDWGINAHTFEGDWVQPLGGGWSISPHIRYSSQSKADFYQPTFTSNGVMPNPNYVPGHNEPTTLAVPDNFSSDQRLSGYGTLIGGVTVSKEFAKGMRLETGFEYYTHQGDLKLGGGGEDNFADFDYWVANASLKVNLAALIQHSATGNHQFHHLAHPNIPAGVLFGHTLEKVGDIMFGYRYLRNWQAGKYLQEDSPAGEEKVLANGCPDAGNVVHNSDGTVITGFGSECSALAKSMTMNMHMLDIMYAPTDWLTLMLMPQFMDMEMPVFTPGASDDGGVHGGESGHVHQTGGVGDTGMYALVELFDRPTHHIHATLGFTAPTGDVNIKLKERSFNGDAGYIHYGMQLGSGTWDFKPSLTYTGKAGVWSWGAQMGGTKRMESTNSSGYALGDIFETSLWGGFDWTNWLSTTVRVAYNWQGAIKGRYHRSTRDDERLSRECSNRASFTYPDDTDGDGISDGPPVFHEDAYQFCLLGVENTKKSNDAADRTTPMDHGGNYGGHYVDIGFGISATVPSGAFAGNRLAFEWLQPVYTNVNGYQLNRDGALSFTWSYGF